MPGTPLIVLGIETSCDETAAALVNSEGKILSSLVLSQIEEHRIFGGVVPEIAARAHIDHLSTLIQAAMDDAGLTFKDLDGVAATCGPGLIGGVMIGMMAGKAIAASQSIPFIAINHLEGHALTPRLTDKIDFPYLLLLVSGGHTQILVVENIGQYRRLGTTLDDAAGECFDKSAKLMGLPYPGGPQIQEIATECKDLDAALKRFPLPTPMKGRSQPDFSFSGLKTALRLHVEKLPAGDLKREDIADLACAFQHTIAEVIADRCEKAIALFKQDYNPEKTVLVVSGGVAANTAIRSRLDALCKKHAIQSYAPPLSLCGDNAAMIAWAGLERLRLGLVNPLDFKARPRWPLDPDAEPRHGAGVKA
ncbi:MAG: tRNA (adenosine(37)-N6)-threonylcarbamoyltransferase complex transferase subunit TsaD [Alphaproteobacteria bacterium]|nr:tRNA (adenosine(37)-N6)-threonylcarbamoyltransferase complex transferase subunit TsaD [Alphaproteobacteria bacterium]